MSEERVKIMKNSILKIIPAILAVSLLLTGCDNSEKSPSSGSVRPIENSANADNNSDSGAASAPGSDNIDVSGETQTAKTLKVTFGGDGTPFIMHLYDNPTAAAIVKHVGTARWQLPIYHYDDYPNWEVMQYYDIPSRYEIPSDPQTISSEKAGEVYYSEPNRIVLFFGDAQVSNEYTLVGYFEPTREFISAVENNPVLEGWGNKIVIIQPDN